MAVPSSSRRMTRRKWVGRLKQWAAAGVLVGTAAGLFLTRPRMEGLPRYLHGPPIRMVRELKKGARVSPAAVVVFMRIGHTLTSQQIDYLRKIGWEKEVGGEKEFRKQMRSRRGLGMGFWRLMEDAYARLGSNTHLLFHVPLDGEMRVVPFSRTTEEMRIRMAAYAVVKGEIPLAGEEPVPFFDSTLSRTKGVVDYPTIFRNATSSVIYDEYSQCALLSPKQVENEVISREMIPR